MTRARDNFILVVSLRSSLHWHSSTFDSVQCSPVLITSRTCSLDRQLSTTCARAQAETLSASSSKNGTSFFGSEPGDGGATFTARLATRCLCLLAARCLCLLACDGGGGGDRSRSGGGGGRAVRWLEGGRRQGGAHCNTQQRPGLTHTDLTADQPLLGPAQLTSTAHKSPTKHGAIKKISATEHPIELSH